MRGRLNSWWIWGFSVVAVAAVLPVAAHFLRTESVQLCALDGVEISAQQRVEFRFAGETPLSFCSLTCAEMWLTTSGRSPQSILVTDEVSGAQIPADQAFYVRSRVLVNRVNRETRHVFQSQDDALAHVQQFQGQLLDGPQRPFGSMGPVHAPAP